MATAKLQQTRSEDINLAGPSLQHIQHQFDTAYFEEGYEEANPWTKDDTRLQEFSLARVFPRELRWEGPDEQRKPSHVQDEAGEKGESEPSTLVAESQDQRQRREWLL